MARPKYSRRTCQMGIYRWPRSITPPPLQDGPWHRVPPKDFDIWRTSCMPSRKSPVLIVPHQDALDDAPAPTYLQSALRTYENTGVSSECGLDSLPVELLIRILEPVVPMGRIFQLSPRGAEGTMDVLQVIGQIRNGSSESTSSSASPRIVITELALCGRTVKEVVYSLFYGRNQFVLGLAAVSHGSHVAVPRNMSAVAWNRITPQQPCLSQEVCRYVKDLTISIGLAREGGTVDERKIIKSQLQEFALAWKDQDCVLKKITIGITTLKKVEKKSTSTNLQVCHGSLNEGIRMSLMDGSAIDTSIRRVTRSSEAIADMISPLTDLEAVELMVVQSSQA